MVPPGPDVSPVVGMLVVGDVVVLLLVGMDVVIDVVFEEVLLDEVVGAVDVGFVADVVGCGATLVEGAEVTGPVPLG